MKVGEPISAPNLLALTHKFINKEAIYHLRNCPELKININKGLLGAVRQTGFRAFPQTKARPKIHV